MDTQYDILEEQVQSANEAPTMYAVNVQQRKSSVAVASKRNKEDRMRLFCQSHFDEDFAAEMEAKNFLIDAPQPSNEDEFENIDKMFEEAEESGVCSDDEVKMMFAI